MAKSAAEERRELAATVAILEHQVDALTKSLDKVWADRDARVLAHADSQIEAAVWRAEALALAREFAEFKRRAEVREQRWWTFAMAAVTAGLGLYYLRKQP